MDMVMHDQTLAMYRLLLNQTTDDENRRRLLALIAQENKREPRRRRTAPNLYFSGRDGSRGFGMRAASARK